MKLARDCWNYSTKSALKVGTLIPRYIDRLIEALPNSCSWFFGDDKSIFNWTIFPQSQKRFWLIYSSYWEPNVRLWQMHCYIIFLCWITSAAEILALQVKTFRLPSHRSHNLTRELKTLRFVLQIRWVGIDQSQNDVILQEVSKATGVIRKAMMLSCTT